MNQYAALYIHYPFCQRKCAYCDFTSLPLASHGELATAYPALLRAELALWAGEADFSGLRTVYFGGGTPSLLEPRDVAGLLAMLPKATEITLEANPGTVDAGKLAAFRKAGVNRLCLGAQSFQARLLQAMGRQHSPGDIGAALAAARRAGFGNVGLDLIYGLPGQSLADWRLDVETTVSLQPEHLSLYALSLSESSPWGALAAVGQLFPAGEDLAADMEELAVALLKQAGYGHYEIANFSRPGYESQHNSIYWRRENYLGLGAAAASCAAGHRWVNGRDPYAYAEAIRGGRLALAEEEWLDDRQVLGEALFLGLRLLAGVDLAAFAGRYGVDPARLYEQELRPLLGAGLVTLDDTRLCLTEKGVLLSNQVFSVFV